MFCFRLVETPIFIVFSAKMQNLEKHKKEKKALFVNTTVLIALVKMSVFFLHFSFLLFLEFPFFQRCFWWVSKNQKITKYQSKENNNNGKQDAKQKQMKYCDSKQDKTTGRKKKQKLNNILKQNANKTKRKKQEPDTEMRNRKEGRKKRTRARQRKRKWKRRRPKKAKEKQRETQKNTQKCPFLGGKTGFPIKSQKKEKHKK